jgi:hypothetical protein
LLICLALSTVVFLAVEGEKWLIRRRALNSAPAVTGRPQSSVDGGGGKTNRTRAG